MCEILKSFTVSASVVKVSFSGSRFSATIILFFPRYSYFSEGSLSRFWIFDILFEPSSIIVRDGKSKFSMVLILFDNKNSFSSYFRFSNPSIFLILLYDKSSNRRFTRVSNPSILTILLSYNSNSTNFTLLLMFSIFVIRLFRKQSTFYSMIQNHIQYSSKKCFSWVVVPWSQCINLSLLIFQLVCW